MNRGKIFMGKRFRVEKFNGNLSRSIVDGKCVDEHSCYVIVRLRWFGLYKEYLSTFVSRDRWEIESVVHCRFFHFEQNLLSLRFETREDAEEALSYILSHKDKFVESY